VQTLFDIDFEDLVVFIMQQYLSLGKQLANVFISEGFPDHAERIMKATTKLDSQVR
jgi:hypothetical protein